MDLGLLFGFLMKNTSVDAMVIFMVLILGLINKHNADAASLRSTHNRELMQAHHDEIKAALKQHMLDEEADIKATHTTIKEQQGAIDRLTNGLTEIVTIVKLKVGM